MVLIPEHVFHRDGSTVRELRIVGLLPGAVGVSFNDRVRLRVCREDSANSLQSSDVPAGDHSTVDIEENNFLSVQCSATGGTRDSWRQSKDGWLSGVITRSWESTDYYLGDVIIHNGPGFVVVLGLGERRFQHGWLLLGLLHYERSRALFGLMTPSTES